MSVSATSSSSSSSLPADQVAIEMHDVPGAAPTDQPPPPPPPVEDKVSAEAARIDQLLVEMYKKSDEFYEKIKGKDLEVLKPKADKCKQLVYDRLTLLLKNRRREKKHNLKNNKKDVPPDIESMIPSMEAIRNWRFLHNEMSKQEQRIFIWLIIKIGANPKIAAFATALTVALTAYTAIAFGIAPGLSDPGQIQAFIISGVVAVTVTLVASLAFTYLQNKYEKLKIPEEDLKERELLTRYFRRFGRLDFEGCIKLVTEIENDFDEALDFSSIFLDGLKALALDCQEYNSSKPHRHHEHQKHARSFSAVPGKESSSESEKKSAKKHHHHHRHVRRVIPKGIPTSMGISNGGLAEATTAAVRKSLHSFSASLNIDQDPADDESEVSDVDENANGIFGLFPFKYAHSDSEDSGTESDTASEVDDEFEAEEMRDTTPAPTTSADVVAVVNNV